MGTRSTGAGGQHFALVKMGAPEEREQGGQHFALCLCEFNKYVECQVLGREKTLVRLGTK